jgi:hypothetical protein
MHTIPSTDVVYTNDIVTEGSGNRDSSVSCGGFVGRQPSNSYRRKALSKRYEVPDKLRVLRVVRFQPDDGTFDWSVPAEGPKRF